ncbi:MAG TPA: aryl-sulfate sulfotransferase [Gemmatimonadaceae bacterium]|nr:aryl-sulfate sulfotransferase [Gemmatimonadaceae bacterium]
MNIRKVVAVGCLAAGAGLAAGCGTEIIDPVPPVPVVPIVVPIATSFKAVPPESPDNVLSAQIIFDVATAPDSIRISYQGTGGNVLYSPARPGHVGTDTITLLGLKPAATYSYLATSYKGGVAKNSESASFTTSPLPADLVGFRLEVISGSTALYTATATQANNSSAYAVIFDPTGAIAWYHHFETDGLQVSNVVMQPNGNITAFIGNTNGFQPLPGYYVEVTPQGKEIRKYEAPAGYYMDDHEFRLSETGANMKASFFTFDMHETDLTSLGGSESVQLAGHQLVRRSVTGGPEFVWSAWDNIGIDEWVGDEGAKATRDPTDFDHPNAFSFDLNGNYLVSWRNLDQITDIDASTGKVLWRIGGAKGDYTFVGDPDNGFKKQHSPKILSNGNLLVYDNGTGKDDQETRAVEYKLDHAAKTATMVWEYRHTPAIYTPFVGCVDRLTTGDTWVAFALAGRIVEVSPDGAVVWESQLKVGDKNGTVYRLVPLASLYGYSAP